jgi:hypothetical protein
MKNVAISISQAQVATGALEQLLTAERRHAKRWLARVSTDGSRRVKGERGDVYAWRQARRHFAKARAALQAIEMVRTGGR